MSFEKVTVCPICNATEFLPFLICKDYTTTGEQFELQQCAGCTFVFTSPRPDRLSIGKYYESDSYISHTGKSSGFFDSIYLIARRFALKRKTRLIQRFNQPGNLLDYGCGTGDFLKEASKAKWFGYGVEPSEVASTKANINNETRIVRSLTELPTVKFTSITLWHVLEHVADLEDTLNSLTQKLQENGTLFVAVPNYKSHDAATYRERWAAYDVPRHLWHFSRETMTRFATKAGLTIVDTIPMKLDAYYVSLLSEKYKSGNTTLRGIIGAFTTAFVSNLKARQNGEYSSVIYILKK